jgi:hypothetical protein
MDDDDEAYAAVGVIGDQVETLQGADLDELSDDQLTELAEQLHALRSAMGAIEYACRERVRDRRARRYETLGADTVACCVRHRRRVRWIPSPGWWIHDDNLPHAAGYVEGNHQLSDARSCAGMWDARSPLVIIRRADGRIIHPGPVQT